MKTFFFSFLLLCNILSIHGYTVNPPFDVNKKHFINKSVNIDHIEMFFQDSIGRVWGGSYLNGVMMFDGETLVNKTPALNYCGIRCQLTLSGTKQLIGTRCGLYLFHLDTFVVEAIDPIAAGSDVIGLSPLHNGKVLAFFVDKIATLDLTDMTLKEEMLFKDFNLAYKIALQNNEFLLMSAYGNEGFYTYRYEDNEVHPLTLENFQTKKEIPLVMALKEDTVWIGSDKGLMKFRLGSNKVERIEGFNNICVKALMIDKDKSLWVGTDNGLYIRYSQTGRWEHYYHDNQDERSLLSNCIWSIYEDKEGNKWLGVDGGLSFVQENYPIQEIKWKDLIPTRDGNRITHILHDSHGDYWFGGISGLGYYSGTQNKKIFFKADTPYNLANNQIRDIYEDEDGNIWIGTDDGFSRFDRKKQAFINCNVANPKTGKTAVWTYGLTEDAKGNLCIATCSGGIFVVDKKTLNGGGTALPLSNYYSKMDIPYRIQEHGCFGIVTDSLRQIWVDGGRFLYKIAETNNGITEFPMNENIGNLSCDKDGMLWGCSANSFFRVHPETDSITYISAETYTSVYGQINCMTLRENHVWFLTEKGVGLLDKNTFRFRHLIDFSDSQYKSCYYDARQDCIWLGGVDNCLLLSPSDCLEYSRDLLAGSILSAVYVNDKILPGDVAYSSGLMLRANENNLAFRISPGIPAQEASLQHGYYYRMSGLDESWKGFTMQHPLIKYSYLDYGDYRFEIGKLDESTGVVELLSILPVKIQAPWYHTLWFRLLLLAVLITWCIIGINHFRLRTMLRIAESEKNNMLKLSQMKMDFLVNISHELKTPLSLMLEPVNQLAANARNSQSKALTHILQKSIKRLSQLVHQMVDYQQTSGMTSELSLTKVEMVEFVGSTVSVYRENIKPRNIKIDFKYSELQLYTEADLLKIESVFNNLLSNACKFTQEGGNITVSLQKQMAEDGKNYIEIKVSDTGAGISQEDLPYIFERFYQAKEHLPINQNGSGIGLSMVKNYVQQHGGEIKVESEKGKGSTFTILLPILLPDTNKQTEPIKSNETEERLRVLIVEDNIDIARFIADNLKNFHCKQAHNGRSGLELAMDWHPDIIITDTMMPIMNGIKMSHLLKKNMDTKTIPIIMLTAKDNEQAKQEAYRSGVDAFISKPFEMDYLLLRIKQLIRNYALLAHKPDATAPAREATSTEKKVLINDLEDEKFLKEITDLIEQYLDDADLNVKKLADLSGYNSKVIYRKLKILVNTTAVDYIKSIRLKKAAILLAQHKFTVSEVMYMVGFSNHSYFAKCFSEKYGKTPKNYMESSL